jgi:hypothetical protein
MAFKPRTTEKKRIHAYIATPAYDGRVLTDYAISLAESAQLGVLNGIQTTAAVMGNGAFIELARNTFVQLFLKTDCTHLFFIDADIRWEARAYVGLLTSGRPICAGVYPKREDPEKYPCHWMHEEDGTIKMDGHWIMCDRVPTGFLCIERKVVEEMVADAKVIKCKTEIADTQPYLFETYVNADDDFVGEDFAFSEKYVRKYGAGIPVYPDFDFTHGVRWKGNMHNYLNRLADEVSQQEAKAGTSVAA